MRIVSLIVLLCVWLVGRFLVDFCEWFELFKWFEGCGWFACFDQAIFFYQTSWISANVEKIKQILISIIICARQHHVTSSKNTTTTTWRLSFFLTTSQTITIKPTSSTTCVLARTSDFWLWCWTKWWCVVWGCQHDFFAKSPIVSLVLWGVLIWMFWDRSGKV